MLINGLWLRDPTNKKPSVSLSLMVLSFIGAAGACLLHVLGKVQTTSSFVELFMVTSGLYFGRRTKFGNAEADGVSLEKKEE